ncbi:MAG: ComEC/Rec2 family competence protein [Faecousia sp.]
MQQKKFVENGKHPKKNSKKDSRPSKYSWIVALVAIALWGVYLLVSGTPWKDAEPIPESPDFSVVFLDVGQADAALVLCEGEAMLIDGGNVADSDIIYTVLEKREITHLDYVVCTHAHEDHVGGLSAALHACTVGTVYSPVTEYDSECFRTFARTAAEQGAELTVPAVGDSFRLGSARVDILACDSEAAETNNSSIVLKVVYGETSFLFTGDAEYEVEETLLESGADLSATVLKVGHHGSDTSTSYRFLNEVMPQYAVISVGKKNSYGHPSETVLSRLQDADATILRTDELGDIVLTSDGKTVR